MKLLPYKKSDACTLGVELELQLINPKTGGHISSAKELIRSIKQIAYQDTIKPEITQSMIEVNSKAHQSPMDLHQELIDIKAYLQKKAQEIGIKISGGGTHPFDRWTSEKIFPTSRFKRLTNLYKYLAKTSAVFGMHMHIGCQSASDALYLSHALARYVPQLIALSAASPFYQGVDTGFDSSRSIIFGVYPSSGEMPYLRDWKEFSSYFYKMKKLGIVSTMKDFYWDIRPKPEFGTVETRICDCPLSINTVINISSYFQCLAKYLLTKRPNILSPDLYHLYQYNRFQAIRFGLSGTIIDPVTYESINITDDIIRTLDIVSPYAKEFCSQAYLVQLRKQIATNDAKTIRMIYKTSNSYAKLMAAQCAIWEGD